MFKIIFMGSSGFGIPALKLLLKNHQVQAVYTKPPLPAGRGLKLQKTPIHLLAEEHDIPVYTPAHFKHHDDIELLKTFAPDLLVVAAYGIILPQAVLDIPAKSSLNIHGSILPRWRGAAPIHRAIMAGDSHLGVSIMHMNAGLDEGDVLSIWETEHTEHMTTGIAHDLLAEQGGILLQKTLSHYEDYAQNATPQPAQGITYAHKITKAECEINWQLPAIDILRFIRALNPFPSAFCFHQGVRYKIHAARLAQAHEKTQDFVFQCQDGFIKVTSLQAENKKIQILA